MQARVGHVERARGELVDQPVDRVGGLFAAQPDEQGGTQRRRIDRRVDGRPALEASQEAKGLPLAPGSCTGASAMDSSERNRASRDPHAVCLRG